MSVGYVRLQGVRGAWTVPVTVTCPECGRVFDLRLPAAVEEWQYGHDCER